MVRQLWIFWMLRTKKPRINAAERGSRRSFGPAIFGKPWLYFLLTLVESMSGYWSIAASRSRILTRTGRLSRKTLSVTRPTGVSRMIRPGLRVKWSCHACVRGLKMAMSSPVTSSIEAILDPLNRLQSKQASARLADVLSPPCFCEMR